MLTVLTTVLVGIIVASTALAIGGFVSLHSYHNRQRMA